MISNRATKLILKAGGVVMLCGATAFAQSTANPSEQNNMSGQNPNPSMSANSSKQASRSDKKFAEKAYVGSMAEIELGQLAAQKGNAEDVKQFGEKMVTDHTTLNDQLKPIAEQLGVTLPTELPRKEQALKNKLQSQSGEQFDQTYIKAMVKDHNKDLHAFRREAQKGHDPQLKDFASNGATVVQEHLNLAEQMAQKHNVKTKGMRHGSAQTPSTSTY
jgi:putative membrane protein